MITSHPLEALAGADLRARELQAAAAAAQYGGRRRQRAFAAVLRWAAERLDPTAPLERRPASQP